MAPHMERVMQNYLEAYEKLYHRIPQDVRALDENWVVVNGARMRLVELEYLTEQMQREYTQSLEDQRGLVKRLIKWFKR